METIGQIYHGLASLICSEELKRLGEKYHIVYKRKRRLPICILFWLLVLSASIPAAKGGLMQLVAFFIAVVCQLFATQKALSLTRIAISKMLKTHSWFFFRAVYNRLLERHVAILPQSDSRLLPCSKESFIVNSVYN